jgi:hypothetical protein
VCTLCVCSREECEYGVGAWKKTVNLCAFGSEEREDEDVCDVH